MRYIVFAYDTYYPMGGSYDIQLCTSDGDEAYEMWRELASPDHKRRYSNVEVYDTLDGRRVYEK